jgi:hypothetical protein
VVDAGIYTSAEHVLRFRVTKSIDGGVTLGFDGSPWHTHANLLVGWYGPSEDAAVHRFVEDLLESPIIIAVVRREGNIVGIRVTEDPQSDLRSARAGDILEFRYWDGSSPGEAAANP